MFDGKRRIFARATLGLAALLALGACAVYEPAPAYPSYGYGYAPSYYAAPPSSFYFGYNSGGGDGYRHRHHHHRW
jgi:hypothetical protein